ncbi:phosphoenolpyruvate phosphomutase-domain-containing protein [Obelidium mucronatum]|nr:phosphoenolpyruvate phosphomutase-domain-containing protein [Obelidium mucronatum]
MNQQAKQLASLHTPGNPVILANVWDGISAKALLETPGASAAATASFAIAAALGIEDDDLSLEQNLAAVRVVARVLGGKIPLSADLQDGYGERLDSAIQGAIEAGAVGCNLEDVYPHRSELYPVEEMVARIQRVKVVAALNGVPDFVINARTDTLRVGRSMEEVVARGKAYLAAGANTVFVWGGRPRSLVESEIVLLVREFEGKLAMKLGDVGGENLTTAFLGELGLSRVSVGPTLMRVGVTAFQETASRLFSGGKL